MEARQRRFAGLLVGAVVVLVLVCRLVPMTHELIGDEAFSARVAALPLSALMGFVMDVDLHPPLYYVLLGAMPTHDESTLHLRLLSFLAGLLQLGVLWALGRRMGGPRLGWICVAFAGVTLLFCRHGWYARNYALLQLFATSAWLVLLQLREQGGTWRWGLLAVLYALCCYTFYYAFHAIAALTVFFVLTRPSRRQLLAYGAALVGAVLLFAPWIPAFLGQTERVRALTASGVATADWSVGWFADRLLRRHLISNSPWGSVWTAIALAGALLPLTVHKRWFRAQPPATRAAAARQWLVPTTGAALAYLLFVLASVLAGSFIRPRYAGFMGTLLCVAVAVLVYQLPRRITLVVVAAIVVGGAVHTITRTLRHQTFGFEAATQVVISRASEDHVVLCANADGQLLYDFHRRGQGPEGHGVHLTARPANAPKWEFPVLPLDAPESRLAAFGENPIWVLWLMPALTGPDAEARLRQLLGSRGWRSTELRAWRGVRLERFVR